DPVILLQLVRPLVTGQDAAKDLLPESDLRGGEARRAHHAAPAGGREVHAGFPPRRDVRERPPHPLRATDDERSHLSGDELLGHVGETAMSDVYVAAEQRHRDLGATGETDGFDPLYIDTA